MAIGRHGAPAPQWPPQPNAGDHEDAVAMSNEIEGMTHEANLLRRLFGGAAPEVDAMLAAKLSILAGLEEYVDNPPYPPTSRTHGPGAAYEAAAAAFEALVDRINAALQEAFEINIDILQNLERRGWVSVSWENIPVYLEPASGLPPWDATPAGHPDVRQVQVSVILPVGGPSIPPVVTAPAEPPEIQAAIGIGGFPPGFRRPRRRRNPDLPPPLPVPPFDLPPGAVTDPGPGEYVVPPFDVPGPEDLPPTREEGRVHPVGPAPVPPITDRR